MIIARDKQRFSVFDSYCLCESRVEFLIWPIINAIYFADLKAYLFVMQFLTN